MTQQQAHGLPEERSRVNLFLALGGNPDEANRAFDAISDIIRYLRGQRTSRTPVTGFTHSILRPPVFTGHWWSDRENLWVEERVASFTIDYDFPFDARALAPTLRRLERAIRLRYTRKGYEQDTIWIIAQPVLRYT